MGWRQIEFPLLVITAGGGFTGLFEYSPAPAAGTLIYSAAAKAGTDPFGNPYVAGSAAYRFTPGTNTLQQLVWMDPSTGTLALGSTFRSATYHLGTLTVFNSEPYNLVLNSPTAGSGSPAFAAVLQLIAGASQGQILASSITGAPATGTTTALFEIQGDLANVMSAAAVRTYQAIVTGDTQPRFTWDSNGLMQWGPGGLSAVDTDLYRSALATLTTDGSLVIGASGTGTLTLHSGQAEKTSGGWSGGPEIGTGNTPNVTNNSNGFPNMLGATISTPSADLSVTGGWRLTEWGHGVWGSTLQTLSMSLIVSGGSGPSLTVPTTVQGISTAFTYVLEAEIMPQTLGAGGTFTGYIKMTIFTTGSNVVIFMGEVTGIAINTTAAVGWLQQSHWASATGTPTITSDGFTFEKVSL